jgi:ribosomal-protein-alanine acetyltransferase
MATELRREDERSAIRALRPEDAGAVAEILHRSPEAVFWPATSVREVLEWKGILGLASEAKGEVVAFLIARQVRDEAEVLNLAVSAESRRSGEGGNLLRAALVKFRKRGARRVFLEVRESNSAGIAFYEKHSFSKVGRREVYYRDPVQAAIVMEIRLSE